MPFVEDKRVRRWSSCKGKMAPWLLFEMSISRRQTRTYTRYLPR